jgi:hypothetical protein
VTIKNYFSKPSKWAKRGAATLVLVCAGTLLGSCGGGGVSSDTGLQTGALSLLPGTGTIYANVPFNFTIAGGRRPYFITTNEQSLIPLNYTLDGNSFSVVAKNPGVVDVGQDPNEVPARSIRFTIRDNTGTELVTGDSSFKVLQNFITGYNLTISSLFACGVDSTGEPIAAEGCSGSESTIDLDAITAGALYQNRQLRFSVNFGEFAFVDKNSSPPNAIVSTITLTTTGATASGGTEAGNLRAFFRVPDTARTQYASVRITDVLTGIFRDVNFLIVNPTVSTAVTLLPATIGPLVGTDSTRCGSGGVDVRIAGGIPPYSVVVSPSSRAIVTATPPIVLDANGIFTVGVSAAAAPTSCLTEPNAITVTDSTGRSATFAVNTAPGTTAPVQPFTTVPGSGSSIALSCVVGSSAQIQAFGGNSGKTFTSSNNAAATVQADAAAGGGGGTTPPAATGGAVSATITRRGPGAATITVSDGAASATLTVTGIVPPNTPVASCP